MAKFVYLQFHNDMALQNAVIEYEVGKEIIFINQDTFLPGFKAETMGSPDKPGGLSIQLCKSEKKEFYIRYSS